MNELETKYKAYFKVDRAYTTLTRWLVYAGAVVLIVIMFIAFIDVIIAKLFGSSIPYATDYITYLNVPLAYLGMAYTLLVGQMTCVDILFGKLGRTVQKVLAILWNAVGVIACAFIGFLAAQGVLDYIDKGSRINTKGGPPVWVFALIETICWFAIAVAFGFCMIREILKFPIPEAEGGVFDRETFDYDPEEVEK